MPKSWILLPEETRVEKSNSRNHDEYEGHCADDEGDVSDVVGDSSLIVIVDDQVQS